jgi:hypothetical protein
MILDQHFDHLVMKLLDLGLCAPAPFYRAGLINCHGARLSANM